MVEKVAKVRALREAFIDEFQGMYVEEEFESEKPVSGEVKNDAVEVNGEVIEHVEAEQVNLDELPNN